MVPQEFFTFFEASTASGAALIGLLFVAISIAPEHLVTDTAPIELQTRATSAFTALFNAFFVSLVALIPNTNVGGVGVTMGAIGLINSIGIAIQIMRRNRKVSALARGAFLLAASFVVYGMQGWYSIALLRDYRDLGAVFVLAFLMIVAYGIGLSRAWELLGARRFGLSTLISLVLSLGAHEPASSAAASAPDRRDPVATATTPGDSSTAPKRGNA